jgi:hypothetical protein
MSKLKDLLKKYPALSWILGFQIFRLGLLPFVGLMPQDAYYYLYGQNLSLSYFDHPGMIGYALRLFSEILGQSVFVVKFTDFFITSLTLYSFYKLADLFLSQNRVWKALLLMTSTVFISILSFNSTPDVPLILFWTLSLIGLYKAIFEQKKVYWILAGIAMGLAFNSKYTALLLQIGLIAFLVFSNKYRRLFLSPWLWLSLLISAAVTFPVWWWNYQNEFASFAFQSTERTDTITEFKFRPELFFGTLGHQALLLIPTLFWIFLVFSFKHVKKAVVKFKLPSQKTLFLLAFFVPTFVGFLLISPVYWVKLNWMMPSYITGVLLASMYMGRKLLKAQLIMTIVFHFALALQVLFYLAPIKSDDTFVGWEELSEEVIKLKQQHPNAFVFSADGYKTSAVLNFYLDEKVYGKNIVGLPALHFDYLGDDLSLLNGKNAIYLDSDKRFKTPDKRNQILPKELNNHFTEVIELEPIFIKRGDKDIRKFWVYLCKEYRNHP